MRLTPAILSNLTNGVSLPEINNIDVSAKEVSHIDDISICVNLHKLNLSNNSLSNADNLSGLQYLPSLTWLNLQNNQLDSESFGMLKKLNKLLVLNLSHNEVNRLPIALQSLKALKALIVNNNSISRLDNVMPLTGLNTLVLSHNNLDSLEGIGALTQLTKLSCSHNNLRLFPDLERNEQLKELRMSNNKILTIPHELHNLASLQILDLGNNLFTSYDAVLALSALRQLTNLTLKGNPICDLPDYREKILEICPDLRILDNVRFDPKFLERQEKRKDVLEMKSRIKRKKLREKEDLEAGIEPGTLFENKRWIRRDHIDKNGDLISSKPANDIESGQENSIASTSTQQRRPVLGRKQRATSEDAVDNHVATLKRTRNNESDQQTCSTVVREKGPLTKSTPESDFPTPAATPLLSGKDFPAKKKVKTNAVDSFFMPEFVKIEPKMVEAPEPKPKTNVTTNTKNDAVSSGLLSIADKKGQFSRITKKFDLSALNKEEEVGGWD